VWEDKHLSKERRKKKGTYVDGGAFSVRVEVSDCFAAAHQLILKLRPETTADFDIATRHGSPASWGRSVGQEDE
jgi:hypothetical protein